MTASQHTSEWIADGPDLATTECLHELYRYAAAGDPTARAVACLHQPASHLASISKCEATDGPYLRWTHAELFHAAHVTAQKLLDAGVRPGMRIVVFITSNIEWHLIFRACLELSCVFCPLNPNIIKNEREMRHLFQIMEPSVFVVQRPSLASALSQLAPDTVSATRLRLVLQEAEEEDEGAGVGGKGQMLPLLPPEGWLGFQDFVESIDVNGQNNEKDSFTYSNIDRRLDDVVAILTTSGTTSLPKGCAITNRIFTASSISMKLTNSMTRDRVICNHLPLNHSFAINYVHQIHISGGCVVHPAGTFDAGASLRAIREERCTDIPGVPAVVKSLLQHPHYKKEDMESVRIVRLGATRIPVEDYEACIEGFGAHSVINGFGMTESGSHFQRIFTSVSEKAVVKIGPGLAMRVCAPSEEDEHGTHTPLPLGTPGELHLGGPTIIDRYSLAPGQKVDQPFYDDDFGHWIKTGDQAVMSEDGDITIVGRYKDMIIRGGENIAPGAIEAILQTEFNLLAEVVALPDKIAGEVPVAIVKAKPGEQTKYLPRTEIKETLIRKYGPMSALEAIIDLRELGLEDYPRTVTGKVQKNVLRSRLAETYVREHGEEPGKAQASVVGRRDMLPPLLDLWTRLLGLNKGTLTPQTLVTEWADSLVLARFPATLKRELNVSISLQDVMNHPEIALQAAFIASTFTSLSSSPSSYTSRLNDPSSSASIVSRDGYDDLHATSSNTQEGRPPQLKDVASFVESEVQLQRILSACDATLAPFGLGWSDVEQITPLYDFQSHFLRRRRPQSCNHRHAWVCAADKFATRTAVQDALKNNAMLRTMAIRQGGKPYHIVIRPSETWFAQCITELDPIDSADDLRRLKWNDPQLDHAAFPGPMFRVLLAPIKDDQGNDSGSTGMVYMEQHSVFDAISNPFFQSDLNALLAGAPSESLPRRVPFKVWVESTCSLEDSSTSRRSVAWNVARLLRAGVGSNSSSGSINARDALFPKQRAPEWFKGDSTGWVDEATGKSGPFRPSLDGPEADGVTGFSWEASFPGMSALKQEHRIDASQILKTALALVNSRRTGQPLALFAQYQAARTWPYLAPWQAARMPPAMDVNGPTVQIIVNAIRVDPATAALDMLTALQAEQQQLSEHAAAPFSSVIDSLKRQGSSNGEAGDVVYQAWRRQIFNWLPIGPETEHPFEKMRKVQQVTRTDVGLLWNCRALDAERVLFMPSWDDAQLSRREVEELLEEFIGLIRLLADRANWTRKVGELV